MATEVTDSEVQSVTQTRKNKFSGQQKKEELEREVSVLRKMLDHEQKVNEFLEKVQNQKESSNLGIPNFLPPKIKELLTELAMVENEITRLESQISQLQSQTKKEKEISQLPTHGLPSLPSNNSKKSSKETKEKVGFETKALHFISKAIKGDYNLNDFSIISTDNKSINSNPNSNSNSKRFPDDGDHNHNHHKDKHFHFQLQDEVETFRTKAFKKSGFLKSPSPMRQPTPRRERNAADIPQDLPIPKPVSSATTTAATPQLMMTEEENIQKLTPNKLSENIMKCLIFIFVRLLRTSRAMEIEKSGPISRSTNFSLSFRAETGLNQKANLMLQKDSRQQDPYCIFDSDESVPRDIGPYKNLVRFTSCSMDPKCISSSSSVPLFQKLKILLNALQKVDLRHLTHQQKLAFWINMYNACIMHGFLQHGVPTNSNPEKLLALLNKATLNIGGITITAQGIEGCILRNPESSLLKEVLGQSDKDSTEAIVQERYGLEPPDPNVTFALCCGTHSSPAVKIYTGEGVISELEKSKLEYLQASIIVTTTKRIAIPELLLRHMNDFAEDLDSLIEWICQQLPTSGTLRKSMVDCFRGIIPSGCKLSTIVEKIPYDFEFQYLLPI